MIHSTWEWDQMLELTTNKTVVSHLPRSSTTFSLDLFSDGDYITLYQVDGVLGLISKKTKYGLKALIHLAREYDRGPILIADLAREEQIPKKFLEAILLILKNSGVLQSKKGKGGGYYLGKSPKDVTFGQAIRIMEGPLAPVPCVSGTSYAACTECENESTCGIRLVMKDVRDAMAGILDNTSLAEVLERMDHAEATQKGVINFCI